jgi:chromosome segregation ATPase
LEGLVRDAEATQERMQAELAATQERTQGEMAEALQRAKDDAASAQEAAREALAAAQQAAQEELAVHQLRAQEELTAVRDELAAAQEQLQQAATAATGEMTEIQARLASLETANAELTQANAELTRANEDLTRRSEEMMQAADGAQQRVADATTAVAATQEEREGLRTRVVELEAQLERASSEMAALASRPEAAPPASNDGDDLRRQNETLREELESMGMRLRRAYADAEDARAQLAVMPANPGPLAAMGGPASADGLDEIHRLRLELGRAVERADAAEARVARLQEAAGQPQAEGEETGVPDEERSLRFRLAKTAARKKGIDAPSSGQGGGSGSMWS